MPDWKDNKHGTGQNDLHCFNCTWFQPWDLTRAPPRPQPSVEEVVIEAAAAIDPIIPTDEATYEGFCRARSIPITNLNLAVEYDGKSGSFKTNTPNNDHELLNEVEMEDSTEFWCRKWTRALYPFVWPPVTGA